MFFEMLASLRARLLTTSTLSQETTREGQSLVNGFLTNTVVDNQPAFVLDDNLARLLNLGEITTNGAAAAVSVPAEDVEVFNFRTGRIEANSTPETNATAIDVTGSAEIRNFGEIEGDFNGVSFSGAGSSGSIDNFRGGVISSDSRAVNIQGSDVSVRNFGDIVGTGNQRNGTIYTNSTAEDVSISNFNGGTIDAGAGNLGSGVSLQVGDEAGDVVSNTLFNAFGGTIQGRGQGAADTGLAGDGIRFAAGAEGAVSDTDIVNSGLISTESNQGTAAGIRFGDGVSAQGQVLNTSTGVIEGPRNGLYIGNAEHDLDVRNFGTIQSGSRAVNIDGSGVDLLNAGRIIGTGNQRNGTIYSDDTASDFSITNIASGVIDAGAGNQGAAISLSLAEQGNGDITIDNAGLIKGRGQASAAAGTAGDGIRLEGVRGENGFGPGLFEGTITNSGQIVSESSQGTTGGFRAVNNLNFQGELVNEAGALIAGTQNGVYFGTGDHTGGSFVNRGTVFSDSRALNIDGTGLEVVNEGLILGTGDQRNGTVYVDGTADQYTFTNTATGVVDAEARDNAAGLSIQNGDVDGDIVSAVVTNAGTIRGRGDAAEGNTVGDGVRLFSNVENSAFAGIIQNEGLIEGSADSNVAAGVRIDGGVNLLGALINEEGGTIRGSVNAIDARGGGSVTFVNEGTVDGNVLLGDSDDILVNVGTGSIDGVIDGGAGDDVLITGNGDNVLVGGLGNDFLDGGAGTDTADFSDLDVAVNVDLGSDGNGTATRETGFGVTVTDATVTNPSLFVQQAAADALYFNIHTSEFPAGEIRGQLVTESDVTVGTTRTITLRASLDGDQEVDNNGNPNSDSEATGEGRLTVVAQLDAQGNVVSATYSSQLDVVGLNEADLQTPVPGGASAIHVHNAPAGQNGPILQDTLVDAGGTLDANSNTGVTEDVIDEVSETDVLSSIENVIGSDDADVIVGSNLANSLSGEEGNDVLNGRGGADVLVGGAGDDVFITDGLDQIFGGGVVELAEFGQPPVASTDDGGSDTVDFSNLEQGVIVDLDVFTAGGTPTNGNETAGPAGSTQFGAILDAAPAAGGQPVNGINVVDIENVIGSDFNDGLFGNNEVNVLEGGLGNDVIHGFAGNDFLSGGDGIDTVLFAAAPTGVNVDLNDQVSATQFAAIVEGSQDAIIAATGGAGNNVLSGFENVTGSTVGADDITGDANNNVLSGLGGNDTLDGGDGDDVLIGGAGDDILTGGAGADIFQVAEGDGNDVITDFQVGIDEIRLNDFGPDFDLSSAVSSARQDGSDAVLSFGNNTLRLAEVDAASLDEDDFVV